MIPDWSLNLGVVWTTDATFGNHRDILAFPVCHAVHPYIISFALAASRGVGRVPGEDLAAHGQPQAGATVSQAAVGSTAVS